MGVLFKLIHDDVVEAVANWLKANKDITLVGKTRGRGFPSPDIYATYRDGKVCSVECKPSDAGGREYATGFGQCIAYLTFSDYSYLALPKTEMDYYERYFWVEDVGLLSVEDIKTVKVVRLAKPSRVQKVKEEPKTRGYGYYRDLRPLEIHAILKRIHETRLRTSDAQEIKDAVWREVKNLRQGIQSERQKNSWILNIRLLLRDLQLINPEDYSLTDEGFRLLQLGQIPYSQPYMDELARCFLLNANYIDILTLIQELNDTYTSFSSVSEFKNLLTRRILEEKLATEETDIERDLSDIPRILRDLNIMSEWKRYGLAGGKYTINWRYVTAILRQL